MKADQHQSAGDDSANVQAGRDVVFHVGVSAAEARQIAHDVFYANKSVIEELQTRLHGREMERAGEMLSATLTDAGCDAKAFLSKLQENERLHELFNLALSAAMRTRVRNKRIALGKSIAHAAHGGGPFPIDEEELMVRALDDLEAAHIRFLLQLARAAPGMVDKVEEVPPANDIAMLLFYTNTVVNCLVATLSRHGLITEVESAKIVVVTAGDVGKWVVTGFGAQVLMALDLAQCGIPHDDGILRLRIDGSQEHLGDNEAVKSVIEERLFKRRIRRAKARSTEP